MATKTYKDPVTGQMVTENVPDAGVSNAPTAEERVSPAPIRRSGSGLEVFNRNNEFLEFAKELIRRKQNKNKDINESSSFWKEVYGDATAFGGERGAEAKKGLTDPSDINYRELSPDAQAGIRLSRQNAATANLRTIAEERKYRGDTMAATLKELSDIMTASSKSSSDALTRAGKMYDLIEDKKKTGRRVTASDFPDMTAAEGIGEKLGGTDPWRHNSSVLLPLDEITKKYGGVAGMTMEDGTVYAAFPDEESGANALKELFMQDKYKESTLDDVLKDITGGKYDSRLIGGKTMFAHDITEDQWGDILNGIKDAEWDDTGKNFNDIGGELPEGWTANGLVNLSAATNIPYDVLRGKTTQELIDIKVNNSDDIAKMAVKTFNGREMATAKVDKIQAEILVSGIIKGIAGEPVNPATPEIPATLPDEDFIAQLIAAGVAKDEADANAKISSVRKLLDKNYELQLYWQPSGE